MDFPHYFSQQRIPKNYPWNAKKFFIRKQKMPAFPAELWEVIQSWQIYGEVFRNTTLWTINTH